MPLLWTAGIFFPGFYFTPDLGDIQGLSCVTSTFSCDEGLESIWVTISPICRACLRGSSGKTEELAFGEMPREAYYWNPIWAIRLVTKYPVSALFQLEVLKQPETKTKPTNPQTNKLFTEESSTSVCVLQAVLFAHKKPSSTHKQVSECNYSISGY